MQCERAVSLAPRFSEVTTKGCGTSWITISMVCKPLKRLRDHAFYSHTPLKRGANEKAFGWLP